MSDWITCPVCNESAISARDGECRNCGNQLIFPTKAKVTIKATDEIGEIERYYDRYLANGQQKTEYWVRIGKEPLRLLNFGEIEEELPWE